MAIEKKNEYVVGSNNDLTSALLNIDLNRIGGDLTYLENDGGTLKVSVGSLIESEGSIYQVETTAATPTGTAQNGAYLFFDASGPSFAWSLTPGTYDPTRGGIYDVSDRRQCRFRLRSATTFDVLVTPVHSSALFDGNLIIDGTVNTGQGATEIYLMNQNMRTTDEVEFAGVDAVKRVTGSISLTSTNGGVVYSALSPAVPNVNDTVVLTGSFEETFNDLIIVSRAVRVSSTRIDIYGTKPNDKVQTSTFVQSGGVGGFDYISIAW